MMINQATPVQQDHGLTHVAVPVGAPVSLYNIPRNATVCVEPAGGGSMTALVRVTPDSPLVDLDPAVATFTGAGIYVLAGPVHELQFAATGVAGAAGVTV